MKNEIDIKTMSIMLGLKKPWILYKAEIDENMDLHLYIKFEKGSKFICDECGNLCSVHDTKEKTWRHLNCFEHKTFIHCKVPRIKCDIHGVHMIDVPWANELSGFTILFEEFIMQLAKKMPVLAISKLLDETCGRLWRIIHRYANEYIESIDCSNITKIGLDETSRKGHEYITIFIDLDTSRIIYIADSKKASTIDEFKKFFECKNGKTSKITDVTCDMSMGFISKIQKVFSNARIIFDKFHVIKIVNEAVDAVRKKEVAEQPELKKSRYIWLKNKNNLKEKQKEKLVKMCKMNLQTAKAYRLKIAFQSIYNTDYTKEFAEYEFKEWMQWALKSNLSEFKNVARTVGAKMKGIINYFESKLTNAVLEGSNSIIQSIKSRARGYKKIQNFKAMIYLMNSEHCIVG